MVYYRPIGQETALFETAASHKLPVLLKGPTGCGKTRFVRFMAQRLNRPLITVACQEDLSAADITGRFVLEKGSTIWRDGPLTRAVRQGAICYLDEVVEARADVLTVLHPLSDDRRILPLERLGEELTCPDDFLLVISYNPGYQSVVRELKESTRQRFVSISFHYPPPEVEAEIVAREAGCDADLAKTLVELGHATRRLRSHGLREGASTRLLIYAATLTVSGLPLKTACQATIVDSLTDDSDILQALRDLIHSVMG